MDPAEPVAGNVDPERVETLMVRVLAITVRADIGGGPEHLLQLTKGYGDRAQVTVACPDDAPYAARYRALENVTDVIEIPHRAFRFGVLLQLRRRVKRAGIQVIHSHGKGAGIYGRLLAALTGVPCLHTFHGLHVGEYGAAKRAVYLGIERALGWFTQAAICVSQGEADQIAAAGFLPKRKTHVVANGVVVPDMLPQRDMDADTLRIVAVNRFDPQKNPDLVVDIATRLRTHLGDAFQLTVLGKGDQFDRIATRIAEAGLGGQVRLAGPSNTPRDVFRAHDFFLSTSLWEGMPLAVLEAMSEGLVPVVTDVVGNRDVIDDGRTGWLFDPADAEVAARVIMAARDGWADQRQAAYDSVRASYSSVRMADETLALTQAIAQG